MSIHRSGTGGLFVPGIFLALGYFALVAAANADTTDEPSFNGPWSATLYAGPSTTKFVSQIVVDGQFDTNGAMAGLAVDRRLFWMGWGFDFEAEGQLSQFVGSHTYTVGSAGLGIRYNFHWREGAPASIAGFTGPSYTDDPPLTGTGFHDQHLTFQGVKLLNYVGLEFAFAIPGEEHHWDAVLRIFHRSGAFGLYSIADDEGTAVGIGVRARF